MQGHCASFLSDAVFLPFLPVVHDYCYRSTLPSPDYHPFVSQKLSDGNKKGNGGLHERTLLYRALIFLLYV